MISQEIRYFLLQEVRQTIGLRAAGRPVLQKEQTELNTLYKKYPLLMERRGAFVTLKTRSDNRAAENLRGCIGSMQGTLPLYEEILRLALESAYYDPRFHPVTLSELDTICIEISVLTPMQQVLSYHDIRVGTDGILLSCSGRHAVFLPQVPTEQQWDLETTLTHLSLKAGLDQDAWKDAMSSFQVFQAEIFSEDDVYEGTKNTSM
jgi:AmmeMemoRadiSam system protein A